MDSQYVTLVRHAKSSWQSPGQADHDRALNERGRNDALDMAQRLVDRGCIPDHIMCSSARRTQETAAYFYQAFNLSAEQLSVEQKLYLATPEIITLSLKKLSAQYRHVMLIGHNPGMEDLCAMLEPRHPAPMPTLAIRHFSYSSFDQLLGVVTDGLTGRSGTQGMPSSADNADNRIKLIFDDYPSNSA